MTVILRDRSPTVRERGTIRVAGRVAGRGVLEAVAVKITGARPAGPDLTDSYHRTTGRPGKMEAQTSYW